MVRSIFTNDGLMCRSCRSYWRPLCLPSHFRKSMYMEGPINFSPKSGRIIAVGAHFGIVGVAGCAKGGYACRVGESPGNKGRFNEVTTSIGKGPPLAPARTPAVFRSLPPTEPDVTAALARAQAALLQVQKAPGYWVSELQGDSILESEYLLLRWILGREHDPDLPLIANYLRSLQQADGGWNLFPGGPSD